MKKNLVWIIIIAVIAALIGGAVALQIWFKQPGIRVLGNDIHIKLNTTGYIIDSETGEVTGQTPVNIDGSTSSKDSELFDGNMTVLGYQNTESGTIESTMVIERYDSGFCLIRQMEKCTHSEEVDGVTQDVEHLCDYLYTYYIYPEKEGFLVALVESFEGETPVYVVCAESEEQALEDYRWLLENDPQ